MNNLPNFSNQRREDVEMGNCLNQNISRFRVSNRVPIGRMPIDEDKTPDEDKRRREAYKESVYESMRGAFVIGALYRFALSKKLQNEADRGRGEVTASSVRNTLYIADKRKSSPSGWCFSSPCARFSAELLRLY